MTSRRNRVVDHILRRPAPPETTGLQRIDSGELPFTVESDSNNNVITITGGDLLSGTGDLEIEVPQKANLKMRTALGGIYTDFDLQMAAAGTLPHDQGRSRRICVDRNISGTINGGGADFDLRSQNGNIYLRKAK